MEDFSLLPNKYCFFAVDQCFFLPIFNFHYKKFSTSDVYFPNGQPSATVRDEKVAALFDKLCQQLADAIQLSNECDKMIGRLI